MERDNSPLSLFTAHLQIANAVRQDGQSFQVIRCQLDGNRTSLERGHEIVALPAIHLDRNQAMALAEKLLRLAGSMDDEDQQSSQARLQ